MRRTTPTESSLGNAIDDHAAMKQFVRILIDIIVVDCTTEQLFAEETSKLCMRLILAKNRGLHEFGGDPWPEDDLAQAARSHLRQLRAAKRH